MNITRAPMPVKMSPATVASSSPSSSTSLLCCSVKAEIKCSKDKRLTHKHNYGKLATELSYTICYLQKYSYSYHVIQFFVAENKLLKIQYK